MKERERKREKRGRKRDEIERSCQRSATSFAGTILFAQTARNNGYDSFSHSSPLRFYTLKIPVNGTIELPTKYIAYIDLSKLSIRFQRKT